MKQSSRARRITTGAVLFALAIVLSALENMLPVLPFLPPGVKLGLSNIPVMYTLFFIQPTSAALPTALSIAVLKALFVFTTRGFTAGTLSALGGLCSVLMMALLARLNHPKLSVMALSMAGGVCHNLGQLLGVYFLISRTLVYYLPALILSGMGMGLITGIVLKAVMPALSFLSGQNNGPPPKGPDAPQGDEPHET